MYMADQDPEYLYALCAMFDVQVFICREELDKQMMPRRWTHSLVVSDSSHPAGHRQEFVYGLDEGIWRAKIKFLLKI